MDNLKELLGGKRIDRIPNAQQVVELYGVKDTEYEKSFDGGLST